MKAKNAKNRDNKIISLNSDNDSESEEEIARDKGVEGYRSPHLQT